MAKLRMMELVYGCGSVMDQCLMMVDGCSLVNSGSVVDGSWWLIVIETG